MSSTVCSCNCFVTALSCAMNFALYMHNDNTADYFMKKSALGVSTKSSSNHNYYSRWPSETEVQCSATVHCRHTG
jgi:hypothetical protein